MGLPFGGYAFGGPGGGGGSGGGGGGTAPTPDIVYVSADGNDESAVVGSPAQPFGTRQAAYEAVKNTTVPKIIRYGAGDFGALALTANYNIHVDEVGMGPGVTFLGEVFAGGAYGLPSAYIYNEESDSYYVSKNPPAGGTG